MDESPVNVRRYIEHLLDEGRVTLGLAEVARTVRPRFSEPSEASDSKGPAGSAAHYASIYKVRFDSIRRTGHTHRGFQETIDCLKFNVDSGTHLRLLALHNDGPLFIFLVEIETERLVGLMFVEVNEGITDEYRKFVSEELSANAAEPDTNKNDFVYLRAWHLWPDEKLRSMYSEETHAWMLRVQEALGSEEERAAKVNLETFPGLVRALRTRLHEGSQTLGNAIIQGGKLADEGKPNEATAVFQAFLDHCPSKFYRTIVEDKLKALAARS